MPFTIADEREGLYAVRKYQHVIVDTEARPGSADFEDLARGCDLLVIPTVPASIDTDVLILTLAAAQKLVPDKYRVLLTKVPPSPEPEGAELRKELKSGHIPVFNAEIPRLKAFEHAAAAGVQVSTLTDERGRRMGSISGRGKGGGEIWQPVNSPDSAPSSKKPKIIQTSLHVSKRRAARGGRRGSAAIQHGSSTR
jgi:hypothetical protein